MYSIAEQRIKHLSTTTRRDATTCICELRVRRRRQAFPLPARGRRPSFPAVRVRGVGSRRWGVGRWAMAAGIGACALAGGCGHRPETVAVAPGQSTKPFAGTPWYLTPPPPAAPAHGGVYDDRLP